MQQTLARFAGRKQAPGEEIPEQHWMVRWAKKFRFNDFNAYKNVAHDAETNARDLRTKLEHVGTADV